MSGGHREGVEGVRTGQQVLAGVSRGVARILNGSVVVGRGGQVPGGISRCQGSWAGVARCWGHRQVFECKC